MIAKGKFAAEVVSAVLTESSKGTAQVAVEFRLLEGPNEGDCLSEYLALSDAAWPYSIEKLNTCGFGGDFGNLEKMPGTKVRLVLVHEDYEGKTRARVKFINEYREAPKLDAGKKQSMVDRLNAKIAAVKAATEDGSSGSSGPPPHSDDDRIPF